MKRASTMKRSYSTPVALPPIGDGPPSAVTAQKASNYKVLSHDGTPISLNTILMSTSKSKVLVIFIRHFFCGNCQEYIRRITTALPPFSLPSDLSIIIVGCGAPSLIQSYVELTDCPYPIYADPRTKLYKALGMNRTLSLGTRNPDYIRHSLLAGCLKSVVQGIKRIGSGDMMQAGDLNVNGGEFLFWRDGAGDWKVGWCHRMQNSRDHTELEELKRHIGMSEEEVPEGRATEKERPRPMARRATTSNLQRRLSQSLTRNLIRTVSSKGQEPAANEKVALLTIHDETNDTVIEATKG